jgi:chromosome partitioning protein
VRAIAIVAQKGGAGKTTVSVHLAVAALFAGEKVAILDIDPQRSALTWAETREANDLTVVAIDPTDVRAALDEARSDGFTVVFLDTAPPATSIATAIVEAADFAVVPVRPSAFDLRTLDQSLAIVAAARRPGIILLNACPARAPEVSEARSICTDRILPLSTVELGDRRAYARAVQSGRAVMEFEPKGAAADEIARLWHNVDSRSTQHALV